MVCWVRYLTLNSRVPGSVPLADFFKSLFLITRRRFTGHLEQKGPFIYYVMPSEGGGRGLAKTAKP